MRIKALVLIIAFAVAGLLLASPALYAGDYVDVAKVELRPQYLDKLNPVYKAWDKYAKGGMSMYPDQIAKIQANIAIAESYADENDMANFKKQMKKLKKAPKLLKKFAKKARLYFAPYKLEMK